METPEKTLFRGSFGPKERDIDFSGMTPEQTSSTLISVIVRDMIKERASERRWHGCAGS